MCYVPTVGDVKVTRPYNSKVINRTTDGRWVATTYNQNVICFGFPSVSWYGSASSDTVTSLTNRFFPREEPDLQADNPCRPI